MRACGAALAISLALGACGGGAERTSTGTTETQPRAGQSADAFSRIPRIVQTVQPSIVTVFAGQGVSSGVVYPSDRIILTNEHVVSGSSQLVVAFANGRRDRGQVFGTDPDTDLAVIRVDRKGLPAARVQTSLPDVGNLAVVLGARSASRRR